MLIKPYYPVTLTIDEEAIVLRIKRMTDEEFAAFSHSDARVATPTIGRFVARQTGVVAARRILWATPPRHARERPVRPCVVRAIRSTTLFFT